MTFELLGTYQNGNYNVYLFKDGTKLRVNDLDNLTPAFPESMDLKICNRCGMGCEQCFVAGTKILMADYTYKNIEDVEVGDEIIGFEEFVQSQGSKRRIMKTKVLKKFVHVEEEILHIKTQEGNEVYVTPNHPFLSSGHGAGHERKFAPIERVKIGNDLYAFGFPVEEIDLNSDGYMLGYAIGSWVGDGSMYHGTDKNGFDVYNCRFVTLDEEINDRVYEATSRFIDGFYRLDFKMTGEEERIRSSVRSNAKEVYDAVNKLIKENIGHNVTKEYACGFLGGFCDSEGHVDNQRGVIRLTNTNTDYLDECERCLGLLGLQYVRENHQRPKGWENWNPVYNTRVIGQYGASKFLWYARPVCKRKSFENYMANCTQYHRDKLVSVEKMTEKQYVYNMETECHTYIANNLMVHNCHECSTPDGALGDLNAPFLSTLHPYTELAIGGGNPLEHPGLEQFLYRMKEQKVVCNMTVHLTHFLRFEDLLRRYQQDGLIHGLGVSIPEHGVTDEAIAKLESFSNLVLHVIAGIVSKDTMNRFANRHLKLLILGFKDFGRGHEYAALHPDISLGIDDLAGNLDNLQHQYDVISFDNLAIAQLNVRKFVGEEVWSKNYMGDDGQFTMYADLVKNEFAISSTSPRHSIIHDNIDDMFASVRKMREEKTNSNE